MAATIGDATTPFSVLLDLTKPATSIVNDVCNHIMDVGLSISQMSDLRSWLEFDAFTPGQDLSMVPTVSRSLEIIELRLRGFQGLVDGLGLYPAAGRERSAQAALFIEMRDAAVRLQLDLARLRQSARSTKATIALKHAALQDEAKAFCESLYKLSGLWHGD